MPRNRRGSIWKDRDGNIYGRVTWTDETGKRQDRKRKALTGTRREAWSHVSDLLKELDELGAGTLDAARMTFKDLADFYKTHYLIPPTYDEEGNKTSGLRSWYDFQSKLKVQVERFGRRRLRDITYLDLKQFKTDRLRTPTERDVARQKRDRGTDPNAPLVCTRAIASVNRELALLHRVFSVAYQNRWILRNPFDDGDALSDIAHEKKRERIATDDEEDALLAACVDERAHLLPFLLSAFDTGMRAAELYNLTPEMVDLEKRKLLAISFKGRKRRERVLSMTPRMVEAFKELFADRTFEPGETVFKFKSFKRSFRTAKKIAGLDGFRLHDVRHTTATRLNHDGQMPIELVGKLLGHTDPRTTWRYLHADSETQDKAADILANRRKKKD